MREVYSNITKVMIDARNNSSLLNLPLDKLLQQSAAAPAAPATGAAATPPTASEAPPPSNSVDVRSRENQRGRDRDSR
jgi:membrane protease subunit HflK